MCWLSRTFVSSWKEAVETVIHFFFHKILKFASVLTILSARSNLTLNCNFFSKCRFTWVVDLSTRRSHVMSLWCLPNMSPYSRHLFDCPNREEHVFFFSFSLLLFCLRETFHMLAFVTVSEKKRKKRICIVSKMNKDVFHILKCMKWHIEWLSYLADQYLICELSRSFFMCFLSLWTFLESF